jgi:hypothetical protein
MHFDAASLLHLEVSLSGRVLHCVVDLADRLPAVLMLDHL